MSKPTNTDATPKSDDTATQTAPPKETDWVAEARKWEARAKENAAKAKANEEAAARLAAQEEAGKTELQKAQEAAARYERELQEARAQVLTASIAADKGIPVGLLKGTNKEELEAHAAALLAWKDEVLKDSTPPNVTPHLPGEGTPPAIPLNGDGIENALRAALGL